MKGDLLTHFSAFKHLQERGFSCHAVNIKPLLKQMISEVSHSQSGLLLSDPKSFFKIKVYFVFDLEIKVMESGRKVALSGDFRLHVSIC